MAKRLAWLGLAVPMATERFARSVNNRNSTQQCTRPTLGPKIRHTRSPSAQNSSSKHAKIQPNVTTPKGNVSHPHSGVATRKQLRKPVLTQQLDLHAAHFIHRDPHCCPPGSSKRRWVEHPRERRFQGVPIRCPAGSTRGRSAAPY